MFIRCWLLAILFYLIIDALWLGVVAKSLYQKEMASIIAPHFKLWPAACFYLLYGIAIVALAVYPSDGRVLGALARGALLGATAYGAYNFTGLAIIKDWPFMISWIDLGWGTFATAITSALTASFTE